MIHHILSKALLYKEICYTLTLQCFSSINWKDDITRPTIMASMHRDALTASSGTLALAGNCVVGTTSVCFCGFRISAGSSRLAYVPRSPGAALAPSTFTATCHQQEAILLSVQQHVIFCGRALGPHTKQSHNITPESITCIKEPNVASAILLHHFMHDLCTKAQPN